VLVAFRAFILDLFRDSDEVWVRSVMFLGMVEILVVMVREVNIFCFRNWL